MTRFWPALFTLVISCAGPAQDSSTAGLDSVLGNVGNGLSNTENLRTILQDAGVGVSDAQWTLIVEQDLADTDNLRRALAELGVVMTDAQWRMLAGDPPVENTAEATQVQRLEIHSDPWIDAAGHLRRPWEPAEAEALRSGLSINCALTSNHSSLGVDIAHHTVEATSDPADHDLGPVQPEWMEGLLIGCNIGDDPMRSFHREIDVEDLVPETPSNAPAPAETL